MSKNKKMYSDPVMNMLIVMKNGNAYHDIMDIDNYFAGTYPQMCMLSDYLAENGYNFMYNPRKTEVKIQDFNTFYWYEIIAGEKTVTAGFELYSGNYPKGDLLEKWCTLNKPKPLTPTQRAIVRLMHEPRDIMVLRKHMFNYDITEIHGVSDVGDYIKIPASFITEFDLSD